MPKIAGIMIDKWKLPIFKKHLEAANVKFTEAPGVTSQTLCLKAEYEWLKDLQPIVEAANKECDRAKRHH